MPLITIPGNKHTRMRFRVPSNGWIQYRVESQEHPVTTYLFDKPGLDEFYGGQGDIYSHGGFSRRKRHEQEIRLLFAGHWYLVILNPEPTPVHVFYEVHS